ncbi:hypothetical protein [Mesorhizobium sp. WSM4904]|uniref:tyrosine-type recombinase/integrase n=1 Tax=Mesorhizobium sp. WSM4904 TaxID=3038545 RepID=UPI00325C21AE
MSVVRIRLWAPFPLLPTLPCAEAVSAKPSAKPSYEDPDAAQGNFRRWNAAFSKCVVTLPPDFRQLIEHRLTSYALQQGRSDGHGFRATASTLLNECGKWHPNAIERQLVHIENNDVRRAYAGAEHWEERVKMMQWWADYLDELEGKNPQLISNRGTRQACYPQAITTVYFEPINDGSPQAETNFLSD